MSVVFGFLFDIVWNKLGETVPRLLSPMKVLPGWFETGTAIVLGGLIIVVAIHGLIHRSHKH